MYKYAFITFFLILTTIGYSQIKLDAQIGGSNILGLSLNAAYDILNSKSGQSYLTPSLGVGFFTPIRDMRTSIIHYGLNYQIGKFGIGGEVSGFTPTPFFGNGETSLVDMLVYPNINYTIFSKSCWYYKFSVGAYFAFSKSTAGHKGQSRMEFEGDVIPGAGFSLGYRFITISNNKATRSTQNTE
jgi:hypothetical protein